MLFLNNLYFTKKNDKKKSRKLEIISDIRKFKNTAKKAFIEVSFGINYFNKKVKKN